jgi:hypothetical protein
MKLTNLEKFKSFEIERGDLASLKGGLCLCKQAAPYACTAAGYAEGTVLYHDCTVDVYVGCERYDSSCQQ